MTVAGAVTIAIVVIEIGDGIATTIKRIIERATLAPVNPDPERGLDKSAKTIAKGTTAITAIG